MIKIFLLRLLVFFLSFVVLLKLPGIYDNNATNNQPRDLNSIGCSIKQSNTELLFLGSSYTYSALNPTYFDSLGLKSFNLGISGSGIYFIDLILGDYYETVEIKPRYLIIDVSPFSFCDKSDDFLSYPLHRYLNKPITHEALLWKYPEFTPNYLIMLANSCKKGLSCILRSKGNINDTSCNQRGFLADNSVIDHKIEKEDSVKFKFLKDAKFVEKKLLTLNDIAKKYREKGCEIFWFEAPTQQLKYFFNSEYIKDYKTALSTLRRNEYMKEFELNDLIFERDDFRNTDHLNSKGAKKISTFIANQLSRFIKSEN